MVADKARVPILCGRDEVERLHSIAYTAAVQTGAKGDDLDQDTSQIFLAMVAQVNNAAAPIHRH